MHRNVGAARDAANMQESGVLPELQLCGAMEVPWQPGS